MYMKNTNTLIRRTVPTTMGTVQEALGGLWDDIKDAGKAAFGVVTAQTAAQASANQAQKDLQAAIAAKQSGGGIDTTTVVVGAAAVGAVALILLRRKKK